MLIGVTGFAQTGKDTVANYMADIHWFNKHAFADGLREFVESINPYVNWPPYGGIRYKDILERIGYEHAKQCAPEVRRLLQAVGTEARERFGNDIWVNALMSKIDWANKDVVISDVRFLNEAKAIKTRNGIVVRVLRDGVGPQSDHISETELEKIKYDYVLHNHTNLAGLYDQIDHILRTERKKRA